jgi:hypothetical protein
MYPLKLPVALLSELMRSSRYEHSYKTDHNSPRGAERKTLTPT